MIKSLQTSISRLNDKNFVILSFELFLFSALYGVAFRSWFMFSVMFLGSFWLLNRPRGSVYMIYAMSLLWGFIAFSIGYGISWGWAAALGGSFFLLGIKSHFTSLQRPLAVKLISVKQSNIEWRRSAYLGRQNLN